MRKIAITLALAGLLAILGSEVTLAGKKSAKSLPVMLVDSITVNSTIVRLGDVFTNTGVINVSDTATIDIEGATLDNSAGEIYLADGQTLTIDGGSTGGTFKIGGGTSLELGAASTGSIAFGASGGAGL